MNDQNNNEASLPPASLVVPTVTTPSSSIQELEQSNRDFFSALSEKGEEMMKENRGIDLAVGNLFAALTSQGSKISFRRETQRARFRGSDTPFCEMKYLLDNLREKPRFEEVRYMSEFYTTNGDAFHETLQKWLGYSGFAYGKFKCRKCNTLYPKKSKEDDCKAMFGPVVCCGEPADYAELQPITKHFSGHVDMILNVHGKLLVTELKQMGEKIFERRLNSGYDNHHYHQVQIYRNVLEQWMGEEIREKGLEFHNHVLLWYFDRGDCRVNKTWTMRYEPEVYEREVAKVKRANKAQHKFLREVEKNKDVRIIPECNQLCRKSSDNPYCPYSQMICFADPDQRQRLIQSMIPNWG